MGCIALVRCVLVLRCGLAGVVWYPYTGWSSAVNTSIIRSLRLVCWVISWVVLLWFDVCWYYVVVCLGWCGIRMQAEVVLLIHPLSWACDLFDELFHVLYCSGSLCVGITLWVGCGGVVSVCRLRQCLSLHMDTTPPQPHHNVTPTHSGIRMQAEALVLQPAYGYHTITAKPQRNTNTHRTRAIQPMK